MDINGLVKLFLVSGLHADIDVTPTCLSLPREEKRPHLRGFLGFLIGVHTKHYTTDISFCSKMVVVGRR